MSQATGRPVMVPYWSLGYHLSRWDYDNLTHVRTVVERTREAGIPHVRACRSVLSTVLSSTDRALSRLACFRTCNMAISTTWNRSTTLLMISTSTMVYLSSWMSCTPWASATSSSRYMCDYNAVQLQTMTYTVTSYISYKQYHKGRNLCKSQLISGQLYWCEPKHLRLEV